MQVAEPFSDEAMLFTKELVMQREVSSTGRFIPRFHPFFFFFPLFIFFFASFCFGAHIFCRVFFFPPFSFFTLAYEVLFSSEHKVIWVQPREKNAVYYALNNRE